MPRGLQPTPVQLRGRRRGAHERRRDTISAIGRVRAGVAHKSRGDGQCRDAKEAKGRRARCCESAGRRESDRGSTSSWSSYWMRCAQPAPPVGRIVAKGQPTCRPVGCEAEQRAAVGVATQGDEDVLKRGRVGGLRRRVANERCHREDGGCDNGRATRRTKLAFGPLHCATV